ncbi:hypothetical protein CLPUN_23830 [Clostridium puniceum]|uniref:Polymer-forming cytoskeletal n=1 Tax=Clostridium puniceum TaxID=29367 RepID=A0A1S8THV7_9CLOT|nr:hypothetical protein [Clostridium puniceum]OOM77266.1 hypothetical protein CLPUN_23830 [Clostridium puniceum]
MKKNVWALGNRTISGEVDRVYAAGNLEINEANIKKMRVAGEININDSYINKLNVVGNIDSVNSNFGDFKAVGNIEIKGHSKALTFMLTGILKAEFLECDVLRNSIRGVVAKSSNILAYKGFFKAKTFENLYPFNMSCEFQFNNIISATLLQYNGMLECERFYSFEEIQAEGVNAEFIYIKPSKKINIASIFGSKIIISNNFKGDKEFEMLPMTMSLNSYRRNNKKKGSIMSVKEIEGDKIEVEYVKADYISGIDVVIGDLCIIEKVEYKNSIKISEKAVVNEVIKL